LAAGELAEVAAVGGTEVDGGDVGWGRVGKGIVGKGIVGVSVLAAGVDVAGTSTGVGVLEGTAVLATGVRSLVLVGAFRVVIGVK